MARIRTIKPEFFTSLTIASLPVEARLTFIGLWTHADDEGRCVDDARLIKAALWPLDDRTAADVQGDLAALTEASLITHYTVNERSYLVVTNWREHQKINRGTHSKLPAPPSPDQRSSAAPAPTSATEKTPSPANTLPYDIWDDLLRETSSQTHGGLTEDSLRTHGAITEPSLLEQGTGNREQGTDITPPRPTSASKAKRSSADSDKAFDEFWDIYPRRVAKGSARVAWTRATKRAEVETILAGARRYAAARQGQDQTYTAHPATWLNSERWADQQAPAPEPEYRTQPMLPPSNAPVRLDPAEQCPEHPGRRAATCGLCRANRIGRPRSAA